MSETTGQPPVAPLVTSLIAAVMNQSRLNEQADADAVIAACPDGRPAALWAENERLRATIDVIRDGIENELDGPYMPVPRVLLRRLRPSDEEITGYIENNPTLKAET